MTMIHLARREAHRYTGNGIVTHRIKIGLVMNSSSTVSAEVGLRLVTTPQTIVPLTGSLFCSRQDPYAVRIAFHAGLEEPVEWIFARDLLSRGIAGPPGHRRRASAAVACTRGRRARQRAEHRADLALRPGALRDPGQGSHRLPAPGLAQRAIGRPATTAHEAVQNAASFVRFNAAAVTH